METYIVSKQAKWAASFVIALVANLAQAGSDPYQRPAKAPAPVDNQPTAARVNLGKTLFFDPRLSGSGWISCATCHNPSLGWSDGLPTGFGHDMKRLSRATPTIINAAFNLLQMWDGSQPTLESQALGPIQADQEMKMDLPTLVKRLSEKAGYRQLFEAAYPGEGISAATISKAIASFERTILSTESPFDRWRKGDKSAMSASAKRGFKHFAGKANCAVCHSGFNFADNGFHNIGLKIAAVPDVGRFAQKPVAAMRGAFKTPTLRDIALTAPYMHDGSYRTLAEVVDHYDRGGDEKENMSREMKPLNLTASEKNDLLEFLQQLTGKQTVVNLPQLPQ